TPGCSTAVAAAALSLLAKSDDAPAGSHMPYQASATRSTPLSFKVGASGRNDERVSLSTATIHTLAARCCGRASVNVEIANGIWPPTRSLMIGALPRYATRVSLMPSACSSRDPLKCG